MRSWGAKHAPDLNLHYFRPQLLEQILLLFAKAFSEVQNSFHIKIAECPTFALQKNPAPKLLTSPKPIWISR